MATTYTDIATRTAFKAIEATLHDAYEDTDQQLSPSEYHPRVAKSAFGQFLFHNVLNRLYQLSDNVPNIKTNLIPNGAFGSQHITLSVNDNWFITVSAVPDEQAEPRDARFRDRYASQFSFDIDENDNLVPVPLPTLNNSEPTYIHLLHGPRQNNRRRLGFILVARPNALGEYVSDPTPLETFLDERFGPHTSDEEEIKDTLRESLKVKLPK